MHITQTNSAGPSAVVGLFSDLQVPADLADPNPKMHRFQEGFQVLKHTLKPKTVLPKTPFRSNNMDGLRVLSLFFFQIPQVSHI